MNKIEIIKKRVWQIIRKFPGCGVAKDKDSLKWGIIGTGYMARTFTESIVESKKDIAFSVLSRSQAKAEKFAKRFGVKRAYSDSTNFLKDTDIDIVYIATPVECHYQDIKDCLNAGKNVLCEKPITTDIAELKEIIELAKIKKCFLMEGMWMKLLPTFRIAEEWIKSDAIGEIKGIRADLYKRVKSDNGNLKSVLEDYGEYPIALVTHFLKNAEIGSSYCIKNDVGTDTDWNIVLKDNDIIGIINISSRFGSLSKAVIIGTKGSIEWDSQFNRTHKISLFNKDGVIVENCIFKYRNEGFEYELDAVNNCLSKGETENAFVSLRSSLNAIGVIDNLLKNCRNGN